MYKLFFRTYRAEIGIFLLAFCVHLIASLFLHQTFGDQVLFFENEDAHSYVNLAKSIVAGDGFAYSGVSSGARTPLYPLFLAFILWLRLPFTWTVLVLQGIFASLTGIVIYAIGKAHFSRRTGIIAGVLTVVEPYMLMTANLGVTETLFTFLITLTLYFFLCWYDAVDRAWHELILASFFVGLAALTRPVALYLPAVFVAGMIVRTRLRHLPAKQLLQEAVVFIGIFFAILTPWLVRQYAVFGRARLSTIDAAMLYFKAAPLVIAEEEQVSYNEATRRLTDRLGLTRSEFESSRAMNTFDYYDEMKSEAGRIIRRRPAVVFRFYGLSLVPALFGTGYEYMIEMFGVPRVQPRASYTALLLEEGLTGFGTILKRLGMFQIVLFGGMALWFAIYAVIIIAAFFQKDWRARLEYVLVLGCLIGYFVILMLGPAAHARYRMPTYPLWFLLFAWSADKLVSGRDRIRTDEGNEARGAKE